MTSRCALLAAGLALPTACSSPRPSACEGEPVATFRFTADLVQDDGCPFDPISSHFDVTGTVAFGSGTTAVLCLDRADAEPLRGTRDGDHVTVTTPDAVANVSSCACGVQLSETVEGDVLRGDGGSAAGFSGELRDDFRPADAGASCERSTEAGAPPGCGVPCRLRWRLTAAGG